MGSEELNRKKRKSKLKKLAQVHTKKAQLERERRARIVWQRIFHDDDNIWWCPNCKMGVMKRHEEGDMPFDKDTFNGEGFWECWKCDICGHEELEPFD